MLEICTNTLIKNKNKNKKRNMHNTVTDLSRRFYIMFSVCLCIILQASPRQSHLKAGQANHRYVTYPGMESQLERMALKIMRLSQFLFLMQIHLHISKSSYKASFTVSPINLNMQGRRRQCRIMCFLHKGRRMMMTPSPPIDMERVSL